MDPISTIKLIKESFAERDYTEAYYHCYDMLACLRYRQSDTIGGFDRHFVKDLMVVCKHIVDSDNCTLE